MECLGSKWSALTSPLDSRGGLLRVVYDWVSMGQASPPSLFPALCSPLVPLAPHLAQLDTVGFTRVIWNAGPSHRSPVSPWQLMARTELELHPGRLVVGCPQSGLHTWRKCMGLCICIYFTSSRTCLWVQINTFLFLLDFSHYLHRSWRLSCSYPRARNSQGYQRCSTVHFSSYVFNPSCHSFPGLLQQSVASLAG